MMKIPSGWYAIAETHEVPTGKPLSLERFGTNLVLWRHDGELVVMEDRCPHRSAKLSLGTTEKGCIVCPFHGFQFSDLGVCTYVPETKKPAPNLTVKTYPWRERHGMVFVKLGDDKNYEPPWYEELEGGFAYSTLTKTWECHITRCIENQLDYAHLPFVHKNTIGGGTDPSRPVVFDLSADAIKTYTNTEKAQGSFFQFKFPNIWLLSIVPGKFLLFLAFAPVNEQKTKLYLRTYQKFCTLPLLRNTIGWLAKAQNAYILSQDRRVVLSQLPNSVMDAEDERLYPSDKGIAFFREEWRRRSQS
ncbi:aromatic ring-hydroxylating dioxygenase subunit alpha [soil metagenome]